jgi:hypothetical protein
MAMAFPVLFLPSVFLLIGPRQLSSAQLSSAQLGSIRFRPFCSAHLVSFRFYLSQRRRIHVSLGVFSPSSLNSYTATQHLSYVITSHPILFYPTSDQHTRLESLASMPSRSIFFFCTCGIQTQMQCKMVSVREMTYLMRLT